MTRPFESTALRSFADFENYQRASAADLVRQARIEFRLVPDQDKFKIRGFCAVCDGPSDFEVDFLYGGSTGKPQQPDRFLSRLMADWRIIRKKPASDRVPNWRERLVCRCGLNNRLRAAVHFLAARLGDRPGGEADSDGSGPRIYATEQVTPLFHHLQQRYANVTGSEFLRDGTLPGHTNEMGIRHEDVTALSFADSSFDCILSFDVLEHVPDYRAALREIARCLKPGGDLILSVPFVITAPETLTRARVGADGSLEHLAPAEYHGDPVDNEGILCFYHFGWDLLAEMREAGFSDAAVHVYWSQALGYHGGIQMLIAGRK